MSFIRMRRTPGLENVRILPTDETDNTDETTYHTNKIASAWIIRGATFDGFPSRGIRVIQFVRGQLLAWDQYHSCKLVFIRGSNKLVAANGGATAFVMKNIAPRPVTLQRCGAMFLRFPVNCYRILRNADPAGIDLEYPRIMMMTLTRPLGVAGLLLVSQLSPAEPFRVSGEQQHTEVVCGSAAAYTIHVGGTVDMDNTATRHHETWSIAFQNNIALTLENTGDVPVVNPRVITNDRRKWHNTESMIAEFTAGAKNDQERIYRIWEGLRQNRHHDYPLFGDDYHDPVRFLNIYGGGFCDDSSAAGAALYHTAGFNEASGGQDPFQRALHGHVMCEVWHDGDYQFMDIDQDTFFLDRENRKPISGDTAARDHDYVRRELAFGPLFPGWDAAIPNAALFGADDVRTTYWSTGHEIRYTLRPGERLTYYWERTNKTPWQLQAHEHRYYSNSQLIYVPPTTPARLADTGVLLDGFETTSDGFAISADSATMTIPVSTAYTICGATLQGRVSKNFPPSAAFIVELSLDGENYTEIYRRMALPRWDMRVVLDEALGVAGGAPRRDYWIRIRCEKAAGAVVSGLTVTTDLYAYPIALPRLSVGENAVVYSDETAGAHELAITYHWRESDNVAPPEAPQAPHAPAPGTDVSATYVSFAWPAVDGCDAYALRVSRDPEMKYPYRPNYDVILPDNTYQVPFRGMFSPGETYYWRVRPRLENGCWGDWSPVWTFTWTGPMVPRDVTLDVEDETAITLRWAANPSGVAPVRYRIYGSNEKGFSIGDTLI